jgi:hypothetical protein
MPRVFVHIGLPKTGTTSIQALLAENRDVLLDRGILYPRSLGRLKSGAVAPYVVQAQYFPNYSLPQGAPKDQAAYREHLDAALEAEVRDARPHTLLVSDEALSARLRLEEEVESLRRFLARFGEVKVICYLRRQDELAISLAWNRTLEGATDAMVFPPAPHKTLLILDYFTLLSMWMSVFGRENLIVRRYGPRYTPDLLQDFGALVGLDAEGLRRPAPRNESPSAADLAFLSRLNHHLQGDNWKTRERLDLLRVIADAEPAQKWGASRAAREDFLKQFAASNARTSGFLGLEGPLFDHEIADDPEPPELTEQDFIVRAARLAGRMQPSGDGLDSV